MIFCIKEGIVMNRESEKNADIKDKIEEKGKKASEFVEKAEDKVNDQLE